MCEAVQKNSLVSVADVSNVGQIDFSTLVIFKKLNQLCDRTKTSWILFLAPCFETGYDLSHLTRCFSNLRKVVISMASTPTSLSYLANLPPTVDDLTLDRLLHPVSDFKLYMPDLAGQLQYLSMTRMFHFTKYDLLDILQSFSRLTFLDLTETERLTRGTVASILRECYNLQEFYFSHDMSSREAIAWLELVYLDYQYVTFPDIVYTMCDGFREIYDW